MPTVIETDIDERYRLVRRVGLGGTGTVYQAADLLLGRTVAVKSLDESFASDLLHGEGRSLARLHHRNVVTVFDLVRSGGRSYLVMEYVEGCDLDRWLVDRDGLGLEQALAVFRCIAYAVTHAHSHDVLHCDLKPANVLVSRSGEVKLTDFTLARVEGTPLQGAAGGTASYAAPEQMKGGTLDRRTDVYGLGMLLGRLIRDAEVETEDGAQILEVVSRATAFEPDDRFSTVEEMVDSLPPIRVEVTTISAASHVSDLTRVRAIQSSPRRESHLRLWLWSLMTLAVAAVAIGIVAAFTHLTATASPRPVVIPSLVSTDSRSAQLVIRSLDLRAHVLARYSTLAIAGVVIAQMPRAGSDVPHGGSVTIVVSRGPQPLRVPDVTGLSTDGARARLETRGFRVAVQTQQDVFGQPDRVLTQSPASSELLMPRATVTITVSQAPWWEFWRT